jgi:MFS transporter, DHA2 family, methylenomycin A resistance protein
VPAPIEQGRLNVVGPALLSLVVLLLLLVPLAAVVPAALFVWHERRAAQPVFPRTTNGRAVCLLAAGAGVAFVGSEAFVQLDLQAGIGWSVIAAAVPLILATCAWTIGSMTMARVHLTPRTMMGLGTAIACLGCGIMALPVAGGLAVGLGLTVAALGMGIQSPGLFIAVVDGAEGEEGRVTSSVPVARTIGGGVGIALAGAIVAAVAGQAALDAAEAGTASVPAVHDGAQMAYLAAGVVCALVLPAVALLRR